MCYSDIFRDRSKTNIMLLFYVSWSSQTLRWRFIGNEYIPSSANMVCVWLAIQSARQEVISGLLWIHLTHDDVIAWKLFHNAGLHCEGNPSMADIFPAQMDTKRELRYILYFWSEQADIKTSCWCFDMQWCFCYVIVVRWLCHREETIIAPGVLTRCHHIVCNNSYIYSHIFMLEYRCHSCCSQAVSQYQEFLITMSRHPIFSIHLG